MSWFCARRRRAMERVEVARRAMERAQSELEAMRVERREGEHLVALSMNISRSNGFGEAIEFAMRARIPRPVAQHRKRSRRW